MAFAPDGALFVGDGGEVDVAFFLLGAVALEAVLLEEGADLGREVGGRCIRGAGRGGEEGAEDERSREEAHDRELGGLMAGAGHSPLHMVRAGGRLTPLLGELHWNVAGFTAGKSARQARPSPRWWI